MVSSLENSKCLVYHLIIHIMNHVLFVSSFFYFNKLLFVSFFTVSECLVPYFTFYNLSLLGTDWSASQFVAQTNEEVR